MNEQPVLDLEEFVETLRSPAHKNVWVGPAQERALEFLHSENNYKALLGPKGCGKSTVVAAWLSQQPEGAVTLLGNSASSTVGAFLHGLLTSVGLSAAETSEVERRNLLTVFIQHQMAKGRVVTIVVDDGQRLSDEVLGELARFTELPEEQAPRLAVAGTPELGQKLVSWPGAHHFHIQGMAPLRPEFTCSYLRSRLQVNGDPNALPFTPVAAQMLGREAEGRFDRLHSLAEHAMRAAIREKVDKIGVRVIQEVLSAIDQSQADKAQGEGSLLVSQDGVLVSEHPLGRRVLIGRSEHNDICLADSTVSRHHAMVVGTPAGYYVIDLNSSNGLGVNGKTCNHAPLSDADVLAIGTYRVKVAIDKPALGDPMPSQASLADTGIFPAAQEVIPDLKRVK